MSRKAIKILLVDDDPGDAFLMSRTLRHCENFEADLLHAQSVADARQMLDEKDVDVLFLDYHLGGATGLDYLVELRSKGDQRPIIVATGAGSEYVAADVVRAGADDYVIKSDLTVEVLEGSIHVATMRANQRRAESSTEAAYQHLAEANLELAQSSRTDPLTQVFNRRAWEESADHVCEMARDSNKHFAVFMMDADHFKLFNDTYGHSAGDACLKSIANAIRETVRADDVLGRYGGEEFVLISCVTLLDELEALGERIRSAVWDLDIKHELNAPSKRVTISIGFATNTGSHWSDVRELADQALYEAKKEGRNRCHSAAIAQPRLAESTND